MTRRSQLGCVQMQEKLLGIELDWEFQIQDEKEMGFNSNSAVWLCMVLTLGIKGQTQFQFPFGCTNHGIEYFVNFGQYELIYNIFWFFGQCSDLTNRLSWTCSTRQHIEPQLQNPDLEMRWPNNKSIKDSAVWFGTSLELPLKL